ncbi:MAG: FecR/PupR family sigma factor regulator [Bacteroidota bacterium]
MESALGTQGFLSTADWSRIIDAVGGRLSPGERAAFEAWLDADPERRAVYVDLREWKQTLRPPVAPFTEDKNWEAIQRRMHLPDAGRPSGDRQRGVRSSMQPLARSSRSLSPFRL